MIPVFLPYIGHDSQILRQHAIHCLLPFITIRDERGVPHVSPPLMEHLYTFIQVRPN